MRTDELVLNEVENRQGGVISMRWELVPFEGLTRFEKTGPLMQLFLAWRRAAGDAKIPGARAFDTKAAVASSDAFVRVVDLEGDRIRVVEHNAVYVDWDRAVANTTEQLWLTVDLFGVKEYREPLYQHIDQSIDGERRRFSRLLLPLGGADDSVTDVVVAVNPNVHAFVGSDA